MSTTSTEMILPILWPNQSETCATFAAFATLTRSSVGHVACAGGRTIFHFEILGIVNK